MIIQPQVSITISNGGRAIFQNVKIDVSRLNELGSYEHLIYAADANDGNALSLEGCEICNFLPNNSLIYCASSGKLASVAINNCYIHTTFRCNLRCKRGGLAGTLKTLRTTGTPGHCLTVVIGNRDYGIIKGRPNVSYSALYILLNMLFKAAF